MARIIAVAIQKGGCGKSTTAAELTAGAAARGLNALAVDLDPQGNLTFIMGANGNGRGVYDLLKGYRAKDLTQRIGRTHIIPGSLSIANMDKEFSGTRGNNRLLQAALQPLDALYDMIVIDCPPALGLATVNALTAAHEVLIPLQADALSLQGLYLLTDTINQIKAANNPGLRVAGAFLTRYNARSILSRDMEDATRQKCRELGIPYLDTPIREGIAIREAQAYHQSIFDYAPKSKPAADYAALLDVLNIRKEV